MGIQVIIKTTSEIDIESALGDIAKQCEIFPIEEGIFGLSIPTKLIDSIGEKAAEKKLDSLEHFNLWAGTWRKPKSKWRLW
jgi:hypothetical protein